MRFDDLAAAAAVGLDRRTVPIDEQPGGYDRDPDDAAALLDAAAALTVAGRAGRLAAALPVPADRADPDRLPEIPLGAAAALRGIEDTASIAELLRAAAGAGYRAPPHLLPALLSLAARQPTARAAVIGVLGNRGRWLARQHDEWRSVAEAAPDTGADPESWITGTRGERLAYLAALRAGDPDSARDLLATGWDRETGDDRAAFLALFAERLTPADEPFLEAALDDRAQGVRLAAATLLARLPCAYRRRAIARAAGLLRVQRGRLVVTPPTAAGSAELRDGLQPRPPAPSIGPGAWLVTQLVAAMPLPEWEQRLGLTPAELVALPVAGGYAADVHAGWRLAVTRQREPVWAAALLCGEPAPAGRPMAGWPPDHDLVAALPTEQRTERALTLLRDGETGGLAGLPTPWPAEVGTAVLRHLHRTTRADRMPEWPSELARLAGRALPASAEAAAALHALADDCPPAHGAALHRAAELVELRHRFLVELQRTENSA